jgi:hypothetical protein
MRARDVIARAMRAASSVLLLQTLAEFSNVAIRKAGISVRIFEGQLTLGAPCCRYKRLMTAIFWQPLRGCEGTPIGVLGSNVMGFCAACWREAPAYRRFARWFGFAECHVQQSIQTGEMIN